MSLFGEFHVPTSGFVLHETLQSVQDAHVEIERLVASERALTPTFWVDAGDHLPEFEAAARDDPSIRDLRRLDHFGDTVLYRAEWAENADAIAFAYTQLGASILEANGTDGGWELRMRFESDGALSAFREFCRENDVTFTLERLHELRHPHSATRYGLTPKQHEALETAWRLGYWKTPRETNLQGVADALDITQQSLSDRLRRAHDTLVENAVVVDPEE